MIINSLFYVIDKSEEISISKGALYSLLSIVLVFVVLLIIIGITSLIYKMMGLFALKKELDSELNTKKTYTSTASVSTTNTTIADEDMMVAALVASIDYQNEIKKDVRIVNIKRI